MRILLIAAMVMLLAACSTTRTSVVAPPEKPRLDAPDSYSTAPCELPTDLPEGFMTQMWIERYWMMDRSFLVDCGKRHAELRRFLAERDALIRALQAL